MLERLTSSSLSPCTTWSHGNLQDVFLGKLCKTNQDANIHASLSSSSSSPSSSIPEWNLTPTSKSRWLSHILYDVLYVDNALDVGLVSFQVPNEQTCYFFFNFKLMCSRRLRVCLFEENAWTCCFLFMCYHLHYHIWCLSGPSMPIFCRSKIPNSAWNAPCPLSLHTPNSINFHWDIQATDWGQKTWPAKAWSRNWSPYPVRMSACSKWLVTEI